MKSKLALELQQVFNSLQETERRWLSGSPWLPRALPARDVAAKERGAGGTLQLSPPPPAQPGPAAGPAGNGAAAVAAGNSAVVPILSQITGEKRNLA